MRKSTIATAVAAAATASLLTGGAVGAATSVFNPVSAGAQTTPPTSPAAPTPGSGSGSGSTPGHRGHGGAGRRSTEAVSDTSVAAKAIGIPEADVTTALSSGQSLAGLAKAHNVDPQKVIDALVADAKSELAAAVTGGKLTQAQADQVTSNLTKQITDQVNRAGNRGFAGGPGGPGAFGRPGGPGFGRPRPGGTTEAVTDLSVEAKAIGIPEADVTTALSSGQSLAGLAKAHNVDPQKVIDALVADAKSELASAVTAGKLTQAQADQVTTNLTQRITDQVNNVERHG